MRLAVSNGTEYPAWAALTPSPIARCVVPMPGGPNRITLSARRSLALASNHPESGCHTYRHDVDFRLAENPLGACIPLR